MSFQKSYFYNLHHCPLYFLPSLQSINQLLSLTSISNYTLKEDVVANTLAAATAEDKGDVRPSYSVCHPSSQDRTSHASAR